MQKIQEEKETRVQSQKSPTEPHKKIDAVLRRQVITSVITGLFSIAVAFIGYFFVIRQTEGATAEVRSEIKNEIKNEFVIAYDDTLVTLSGNLGLLQGKFDSLDEKYAILSKSYSEMTDKLSSLQNENSVIKTRLEELEKGATSQEREGSRVNPSSTLSTAPTPSIATTNKKAVELVSLTELKKSGVHTSLRNLKNNIGESYNTGLYTQVYNANISYYLNGAYKKLNFALSLGENYKNYENAEKVYIYGDEVLMYTSPEVKAGFIPRDVSVDITGISILEIQYDYNGIILIGNPTLYE